MPRVIVSLLLALAFLVSVAAFAEAAKAKKKQVKPQAPLDPPMTVVIVRSNEGNCEPRCSEWIMAEGRITDGTPARFRKTLKQMGKRKLPVVLSSSGGSVNAALEIGRMIRKKNLDVGVGRTRFTGCAPSDKTCKLPKENNGVYRGSEIDTAAFCNSACPLILAAGARRLASYGTFVGVHQVSTQWTQDRVTYRETYRMVNGKKKVLSKKIVSRKRAKSYTTVGLYKGLRKRLAGYLTEMGVSTKFFDYMEKAPPSSIYGLNFAELEDLKLITSRDSTYTLAGQIACKRVPSSENCIERTQ